MRKNKYQLFSLLSPEEYAALEADIARRGVLVAFEHDQQGNILDGHHRAEIAKKLGKKYRRNVASDHHVNANQPQVQTC